MDVYGFSVECLRGVLFKDHEEEWVEMIWMLEIYLRE